MITGALTMISEPAETPNAILSRTRWAAGAFATATLLVSLLLQRFAIPVGEKGVDVVGPIGLGFSALALASGALVIHRRRLICFMLLAFWLLAGSMWRAIHPSAFNVPFSLASLLQFLLLNSFCVLSFSHPVDETIFFRRTNLILAFIAVAGILQFALQLAGLSLFAFTGLLPRAILFEAGYHLVIPAGIGSLDKANGFFLLEPSIFSQVLAIGLIIELVTFRRPAYLFLFLLGLLLSFSGTGLIVLASFLLSMSTRLSARGVWACLGIMIATALVLAAASVFLPDAFSVFSNRIYELNQPGTSGYDRFRTPFLALDAVWFREPTAWLMGVGAGATEHLGLTFEYTTNTPIKLILEFGLPSVFLYAALLFYAERSPTQNLLVLPALVLLFFAGSYEQFAPVLFPVFLLVVCARLRTRTTGERPVAQGEERLYCPSRPEHWRV